jgi:hypothetical protein
MSNHNGISSGPANSFSLALNHQYSIMPQTLGLGLDPVGSCQHDAHTAKEGTHAEGLTVLLKTFFAGDALCVGH